MIKVNYKNVVTWSFVETCFLSKANYKGKVNGKTILFWDVAPCSNIESPSSFRCAYWLHHQGDHKELYALMMEALSTSEMLVNFYKTTCCNIPEEYYLNTHCHENLKPHRFNFVLKRGSDYFTDHIQPTYSDHEIAVVFSWMEEPNLKMLCGENDCYIQIHKWSSN
jgi:hypothetical protein